MKNLIELPKKRFCTACLKLAAGAKSTIPLTHESWCKKMNQNKKDFQINPAKKLDKRLFKITGSPKNRMQLYRMSARMHPKPMLWNTRRSRGTNKPRT